MVRECADKKIRTIKWRASDPVFVLFLFYTILIWCCECLDLICWLAGIPQVTLISRIAALILTAVLMWKLVGIPRTERVCWDPFFIMGAVFLAGFFVYKGIRPDLSYDTQNYHLICQIPGFTDNINFHAIPGRFQMYGFRLGDRMFYPFRILFGLRMGTLLNVAAILVIYRQLTVLLTWFKRSLPEAGFRPANPVLKAVRYILNCPSIIAFLLVNQFEMLQESGSYMVELVALPFFLEMVFLLIREKEAESVKREAVVFCVFGGILFCLKMTNIVYLAPLILFYLFKIRDHITLPLVAGCLAVGVIPSAVYLIYNGLSTGNPVYPYYNTIFRSPYYMDVDFKDRRWGPLNLSETFRWVWYMLRYPDYRLSEMPSMYTLDLAAGYLAMLGCGAAAIAAKISKKAGDYKKELALIGVYVISFLAWTVSTGHSRYFMGGLLLSGIVLSFCYLRMLNRGGAAPVLAGLILAAPLVFQVQYAYKEVVRGAEWALRHYDPASDKKNLRWLFRDRELFPPEVKDKIDVLYLTWYDCGSYARLIGEDVPVYNRSSVVNELSNFREQYMEQIEGMMREGKGVYDMFHQSRETFQGYMEWMNEAGYYVDELIYPDTILSGQYFSYTLARLEMADGRTNTWYFSNEDEAEPFRFQKPSELCELSVIAGDTEYWQAAAPFEVVVTASDQSNEKVAAVMQLGNKAYEEQRVELDLSGLDGEIRLDFESLHEVKRAVLVNPHIEIKSGTDMQ